MADPFVGKQLSNLSFRVTPDLLSDYSQGLKLEGDDSIHIPSMIATGSDNGYFGEIAYDYQSGHLWMRQEWELFEPLSMDKAYEVSGAIEEIYPRRNRNVVKYRVDIHEVGQSECAVRSYHHQSFLQEKLATETLEFRDPSKSLVCASLLNQQERPLVEMHMLLPKRCAVCSSMAMPITIPTRHLLMP